MTAQSLTTSTPGRSRTGPSQAALCVFWVGIERSLEKGAGSGLGGEPPTGENAGVIVSPSAAITLGTFRILVFERTAITAAEETFS